MKRSPPVISHLPEPPFDENDLPPSARALLGDPCDPNMCSCSPNPHVTCQWVKTATEYIPAQILNGKKGDLILCASDGSGSLGQLLGALAAPQVYSHMGVMVEDFTTIRHSTLIPDRFQAYDRGTIFGTPEPINGFEPDVVRFGWPGTITQTVDEAVQATNPGVGKQSIDPPPYLYCDQDNGTVSYQSDDIDNHCFKVGELSFNTVYGKFGDRRDSLVVSPCSAAESANPILRQVLHSIADEVKGINGHYRFFAFTLARIAQDPAWKSVGPMPVYRWDVVLGKWVQIENTVFDPSNPCAPEAHQAPVRVTVPVVCSSLPWLAVQNFNARQNEIHVTLDSLPAGDRLDLPGCFRRVQADPAGDLTIGVPDGLYNFAQADRSNAASSFHDGLRKQVLAAMADAWDTISHVIAIAENISIAVIATYGVLEQAILAAQNSIAVLATILQISNSAATALLDLFTKMPDHVANQICNTFAFDNAEDHTSNNWQQPGDGVGVGPDDIAWFWRPTTQVIQGGGKTELHGIYGQNRRVALQQPGWGAAPKCEWTFSPGIGEFIATVALKSNGFPIPDALVVVACNEGYTNEQGIWEKSLPAGSYWATASWQDPQTDDFLRVSQLVIIEYGQVASYPFELDPPPVDFREVDIAVSGDVVIGSIWASGTPVDIAFSESFLLGPRGDPANPGDTSGLTGSTGGQHNYKPDRTAGVSVSGNLLEHGFVNGTASASLNKPDNTEIGRKTFNFGPIAPGQSEAFNVRVHGDGTFRDLASLTITIYNNQSYGPAM